MRGSAVICRIIGHRYWSSISWGPTERYCQRCGREKP